MTMEKEQTQISKFQDNLQKMDRLEQFVNQEELVAISGGCCLCHLALDQDTGLPDAGRRKDQVATP